MTLQLPPSPLTTRITYKLSRFALVTAFIGALGLIYHPLSAEDLPQQTTNTAEKPELVVYTYDSFTADWGPGPQIVEAFEADCDCNVRMVGVSDALNLLTRLRMEGSNTQADVILGLDNNSIAEADALDVMAQHDIDINQLDLPIDWSSETFIPFDYGYFSFVYDANNPNTADTPASFDAFLKQDTSLIIQDPRTSTPGLGLVAWIEKLYPERADQIWQALQERIVVVSPGWSEAYALFLEGEADYVFSYTTSPGYHLIVEDQDHYRAAIFEEGHYLQVEAAGITQSSEQQALARSFLAFLISPSAQSIIAQANWMYPVTVPQPPLPENYPAEPKTPALLFDIEAIPTLRAEWIQRWLDSLSNAR